MAKKTTNQIERVTAPANLAVPDFMAPDKRLGTQEVAGYVSPPRIKVIQKSSASELIEKFGSASVIISPDGIEVVSPERNSKTGAPELGETGFEFTPIFFYAEVILWSPITARGDLPAILKRSLDPRDPMFAKARDSQKRFESHEGHECRYTEHLSFVVQCSAYPVPVVMSFSRGEFGSGRKFSGLITSRMAPIFGGRYRATIVERTNDKGSWYGLDVINPPENPWVAKEDYAKFKELHEYFKEAHANQSLRVVYEDDDLPPAAVKESKEF